MHSRAMKIDFSLGLYNEAVENSFEDACRGFGKAKGIAAPAVDDGTSGGKYVEDEVVAGLSTYYPALGHMLHLMATTLSCIVEITARIQWLLLESGILLDTSIPPAPPPLPIPPTSLAAAVAAVAAVKRSRYLLP
ncbi:hypothetical protein PV325_012042 [Microctonus aethiopoides]|nr:hypothetical protein PV325_012042 [Microctonus aethiopoides]